MARLHRLGARRLHSGVIYRVTCRETGRVYIGRTSSTYPIQRWKAHVFSANGGSDTLFHKEIRDRGPDAFEFEVIACSMAAEDTASLELFFIKEYEADSKGYNTAGPSAWKQLSSRTQDAQRALWQALQHAGHDAVISALLDLAESSKTTKQISG